MKMASAKRVSTGLDPAGGHGGGGSTATGTRGSGGSQIPVGGGSQAKGRNAAGGKAGPQGAHYGYGSSESILDKGSLGHNSTPGR